MPAPGGEARVLVVRALWAWGRVAVVALLGANADPSQAEGLRSSPPTFANTSLDASRPASLRCTHKAAAPSASATTTHTGTTPATTGTCGGGKDTVTVTG